MHRGDRGGTADAGLPLTPGDLWFGKRADGTRCVVRYRDGAWVVEFDYRRAAIGLELDDATYEEAVLAAQVEGFEEVEP